MANVEEPAGARTALGDLPTAGSWSLPRGVAPVASSRDRVVIALREAIVSGNIAAGAQLKQDELAALFRVSPAPVREALRQLESEGLVRHHPNRGAFVTELPADEVLEVLLPIRLQLELHAFRQLAPSLTPQLVAELEQQIADMDDGAARGDVAMINEADVRFHEIVVEASAAFHTNQLWHSVLPRIRRQFYVLTPRHADLNEVSREHVVLLKALKAGDPQKLGLALRDHIVGTSSALMGDRTE